MNNDYIERNISANIRKYRNKKHMTQFEVAETLHVHPTTVQKWERGVNRIYPRELASLCELFDVKIGDMMGDTNNDRLTFAGYEDWLHRVSENNNDIYTRNLNKENDRKRAKAGDTYIDITEKVTEYPYDIGFGLSICYKEFKWIDRGAYIEPCMQSKINLLFYDYDEFFIYPEAPSYEDIKKRFEEFRIQKENVYENIIEKVKNDILTEKDMKDYDLEYVQAFNVLKNNKPLFIYYDYDPEAYFYNLEQEPIRKYVLNVTDKTIDIDERLQDVHSINYGRFLGECIELFEDMYPNIAEIIVGDHCENIHKYGEYWPNVEYANGFLYNDVLTALFNDSSNCRVINDTAYYILDHIKSSKHCDCSILLNVCQNKYLYEETIQHLFNYIFGEKEKKRKNITELKDGFAWAFALNPSVSSEMLSEIYKTIPKKVFSLDSYKDLYYLQLRMAIFENRNCPHNLKKQLIYEINKIKNNNHYSEHLQWFDFCNKPTQEALMEANEKLQIDYRMIADEIFERYDNYFE